MELFVIKDNGMTQRVVELAQEAGFSPEEISVAQDEQSAMKLMKRKKPDIVVVDPHLTRNELNEDGVRVIAVLRQEFRDCVIICLTTRGSTKLGIRARMQGANDYIDLERSYVNGWEDLRERLKIERGILELRQSSQSH
jgi:DNA-binding response OmpR family regulator